VKTQSTATAARALEPQLEQQVRALERAQRTQLHWRAQMAAEIAHDLNNYLAILSGNAELLMMQMDDDIPAPARKCLDNMRRALGQLGVMADAFLKSRSQTDQAERVDLGGFLAFQTLFFKPQKWFQKIVLETRCANPLPVVACRAGELQLILFNILLNAAEALNHPDVTGSTITLCAEPGNDRETVCLSIADDGPGIPDPMLSGIFTRAVTTHGERRGLGLILAGQLAVRSGGELSISNHSPHGVEVRLSLPVAPQTTPVRTAIPAGISPDLEP